MPGDKRACPAAAAEDERCVGCVGHALSQHETAGSVVLPVEVP
jgi:hypothetical protein